MEKTTNNVAALPMSRRAIRDYAMGVRKILGMENQEFFPIVEVIEYLDHIGAGLEFHVEPDSDMGDLYGFTSTKNGIIRIRESVYNGAVEGNPRDRFTLAHELGHYLLHTPDRVSFTRGSHPIYQDPEWQANVFAAELLSPVCMLKGMTIEQIVDSFKVSYECAEIQNKYV